MGDRRRLTFRRVQILGSVIVFGAVLVATVPARASSATQKTLEALPISEPIELDGILDEDSWARAPIGTDFVQREPLTGQPASERTEIRVVYTKETLYIGVRCLDSEPHRIIDKEMQRDQALWRDDSIDILFDTFDDDRNAYMFETNPNGARTDALITDEGRNFNLQWDGVWDVAARKTDEGWSAEVVIPFSTLRFDPQAEGWGFNVRRYIRRRAEETYWAPILLDGEFRRVSMYGRLTGIEDVEQGWNLNVKPFVVGDTTTSNEAGETDTEIDYGLDVKWGIARGLSLDLTLNTDFGETEVDALQVNLTRFSLFFEEKREFFLENAGIFEFGPGATGPRSRMETRPSTVGGAPLLKVFHSRRIGIDPETNEEVPVEWGTRLTGRVGEWNVGFLEMQTDATIVGNDQIDVPRNNWGAIRVTRNFGERSSIGGIVTNRRDRDNTNRVAGLDLDYKPTENLGFDAYFAASDNTGPAGPSDWSAGTGATWNGSVWDWRLGWVRVGDDFDPQMGFLWRKAVNRYNWNLTYEPEPATAKLLNLHFMLDGQIFTDLDDEVESEQYTLDLFGFRTAAADETIIFVMRNFERLSEPFRIPDTNVEIPTGDYAFNTIGARFLTHSSRPISMEGSAKVGEFYDGDQLSADLTLRLRPNRYVRSETGLVVNDIDLPGGEFTANIIRERLSVAITPRLLSNLFLQYNDLTDLLSLNLRFNWIYRPGADLFVVYSQTWGDLFRRDRQFIVKFTYLFQR